MCGEEVGRCYCIVTWSGEENMKLYSLIQVPFGWMTKKKGNLKVGVGNNHVGEFFFNVTFK